LKEKQPRVRSRSSDDDDDDDNCNGDVISHQLLPSICEGGEVWKST